MLFKLSNVIFFRQSKTNYPNKKEISLNSLDKPTSPKMTFLQTKRKKEMSKRKMNYQH